MKNSIIKTSMDHFVGNTQVLDFSQGLLPFIYDQESNNKIILKLENLNPTGSIKDRIAKHILSNAEKERKINKDTTVLCASSGNTAISISMMCAAKGLKCIIFTDNKCSEEKKQISRAYGSEVQIIEKDYDLYEEIAAQQIENSFCVDQYRSKLNTEAYIQTLAPELDEQVQNIDYIISCGSTGGTITGIAKYFKEIKRQQDIQIILTDPYGSNLFNILEQQQQQDPYKSIIEGAGKNRVTEVMEPNLIDHCYKISDEDSLKMARHLSKNGILVGGSSGLNVYCATRIINENNLKNKTIVCICPDAGYRYLSKY